MAVILTSFQKSKSLTCSKFSVSFFQPQGIRYPTLNFLTATDKNGNTLHLRNLEVDTIWEYENKLKEKYKARWREISEWLESLNPNTDIALCCWCPYSNTSRKHLEKYGKFFCHTLLIGKMVEKYRPDINVVMDDDRKVKALSTNYNSYLFEHYGIKIHSNLLKEDIYVVATNNREKVLSQGVKEVVYTIDEIIEMWGMLPDDIKEIHKIKKIVGGKVVEVKLKEDISV